MKRERWEYRSSKGLILIFIFAAIILIAGGFFYLRSEEAVWSKQALKQLKNTSVLKTRQIEVWYQERLADAREISQSPLLQDAVYNWIKHPDKNELKDEIQQRLQLVIQNNPDCINILITDTNGQALLGGKPGTPDLATTLTSKLVQEVIKTNNEIFGDLYKSNPEGAVCADIACPIRTGQHKMVGVILFRIDPNVRLCPILKTESTDSTEESFLFEKSGDSVLYLTNQRSIPNAALSLKVPLTKTENLAVRAIKNGSGFYEGMGYHGQHVMEYIQPIPGSPWFLASKIDRDELFREAHQRVKTLLLILFLIFLSLSVVLFLIITFRRKQFYNQLLVNERQQAALKSHFEYVVKYANDIILLEDENLNIVEANERALQVYQYSLQELLKMKKTDLVAPDFRKSADSRLKNLAKDDGYVIESVHQRKDGSLFNVEISARIIQIDGQFYHHQVIRDITERKRAEIVLRESEERFRTTLYSTGDAIITTDINGRVRYMNPVAEELTGWKEDEAAGKPIREVFSVINEDTREEVENPVDKVLASGIIVMLSNHTILQSKNGHEIPIGNNGAPIRDTEGKITGVVLAFRDQTKERLAKRALEESELHFHNLAAYSPVGIFRTSPEGQTTYVDPRWRQLSGQTIEKALGNGWFDAVHPDDKEMLSNRWITATRNKEVSNAEYRFLHSDGNIVYVMGHTVPEINSENQITGYIGTITDITELKKAEEHYRSLFNEDLAGNFVSTIAGELLMCNQAYAEIMGFVSVDEMLKANTRTFYKHPDDRNEIINRIKANKKLINYEYPLVRKDGKEIFVVANILGEFDQTGNLVQLKGYLFDITKRNQAAKALRESEETFRNYFENSPLGKSVNGIDGSLKVNQAFCQMLGYSKEELLHLNWKQITHPDDIQLSENVVKSIIEGEKEIVWFEKRYIHKNGDIIWAEVSTTLQKDTEGKPSYLITTILDITARKQAERQLRLLGRAVERNPASIVITNTEGIIEYVNPQFTEITGYTPVEVLGKNPNILKSGNQSPGIYRNLWETISAGNIWSGELLNKRKNGELYWENMLISPVEDNSGKITHYVGVKEDISERKKMFDELCIAKEKAEESDRLKSAFLATMSHELRTPLNAVIGFSSLIDEEMPMDQITSFAKMIHNSGNNLLDIVEGILDLTMLESKEAKVKAGYFNLSSFMIDFLELAKSEQQKSDKQQVEIKYVSYSGNGHANLYSDKEKLTKLMIQLLKNALKFTSSGKIEFGYVLEPDGKYDQIKFFMKDTGIGISESQLPIIFNRFRQAEDSYTRKYGGTGIGLAISKQIVELLGGHIWVDSAPGKGSTFYFTIPVTEPEQLSKAVSRQKSDTEKQKTFSNQTILIAEDEDSNFELLRYILIQYKLLTIRARDGLEAVNLCSVHPEISLVLMDINMPNMNGLEATKIIKQANPKLPVIAVTAFAMSGDREKFFAGDCDEYLEKPVKQEKLFTLLRRFMS